MSLFGTFEGYPAGQVFRHQKRQAPELSAPLDACTCLLSFGVFPMVVVFTLFERAQ